MKKRASIRKFSAVLGLCLLFSMLCADVALADYDFVPKTGDYSQIALWFVVLGISAMGLIVTTILCVKHKPKSKKKNNDPE